MNPIVRILVGSFIVFVGAYMVIQTRKVLNFFGTIQWAEAKLGGGGTNLLYKIIGMIACFIGIIVVTDLWDWLLQSTLGSILPNLG